MNDKNNSRPEDQHVQTSILARIEKTSLIWLANRMPGWVTPDMLTYLGLFAMAWIGLCYYLAKRHWIFLILASVGFAVNWFGDSLDGTLARVRKKERPFYGYYLDHLVDAFGITLVILGIFLFQTGASSIPVACAGVLSHRLDQYISGGSCDEYLQDFLSEAINHRSADCAERLQYYSHLLPRDQFVWAANISF